MIDVGPWPGLTLVEPLSGGRRNPVWLGDLDGRRVAVRQSRRSPESLAWELDLLGVLAAAGFRVPPVVPPADGSPSIGGVVVQEWLDGRPPSSDADWRSVADVLRRLHQLTAQHPQRPGCATVRQLGERRRSVDADLEAIPAEIADRLLAVFAEFAHVTVAVIHGDPGPDNIRIGPDGSVGLLDWDESRVDLIWHDLSNLGIQVLSAEEHRQARRLSDAWEAANGWVVEPDYARRRLQLLDER